MGKEKSTWEMANDDPMPKKNFSSYAKKKLLRGLQEKKKIFYPISHVCVTNFMQKVNNCSCISLTNALWNFQFLIRPTKGFLSDVWTSWAIFHFSHDVIKIFFGSSIFSLRCETIIWLILLQYVWMIVCCWSGNERKIQI